MFIVRQYNLMKGNFIFMKLVVCDLDGTLLNSKKEISENARTILKKLDSMGISFAFASGRDISSIIPFNEFLGLKSYFICNNGATIYDQENKLIYKTFIDKKNVEKIIKYLRKKEINFNGFFDGKIFVDNFKKNKIITIEKTDNIFELEKTVSFPHMIKIIVKEDKDIIKFLKKDMLTLFSDFLDITISHPNCLDIVSIHATKGKALKLLSSKLNISLSEIIAFGDGGNDLDMLKIVGHPVIMENSSDEIKCQVKNKALSNDKDGVAIYLRKIFSL